MILHGDCLSEMRAMEDNSVDSIVTDPPYELGFMGKSWDNTGIAYNVDMWKEALRVLKPGGHLLAFSGTRTYHRMAVAIEDAGFEVRDMIEWVYGSGFPKSLNIGKAVDKINGETGRLTKFTGWMRTTGLKPKQIDDLLKEKGMISPTSNFAIHYFNDGQPAIPTSKMWAAVRPICGEIPQWVDELVERIEREREVVEERTMTQGGGNSLMLRMGEKREVEANITKGTSEWEGWGTALKPAHEPICMARKPLSEKTVAENVLKYGTGGINIDESRVGTEERTYKGMSANQPEVGTFRDDNWVPKDIEVTVSGRFPANLIHDNSEEVRECFPETKKGSDKPRNRNTVGSFGMPNDTTPEYSDSGNASRFFKSIPIEEQDEIQEDSTDMEEKLEKLGLNKSIPNNRFIWSGTEEELIEHDTLLGEMQDDQVFTKEQEERYEELSKKSSINPYYKYPKIDRKYLKSIIYQAKASKSERNKGCEGLEEKPLAFSNQAKAELKRGNEGFDGGDAKGHGNKIRHLRNNHPTVKPIALMEYLINMVTPKGGTVLDPFMGSGSTGIACKKEGFEFIGVELDKDYFEIAQARIKKLEPQHELF